MGKVLSLGGQTRPGVNNTEIAGGPEAAADPAALAYQRRVRIFLPVLVALLLMMSGFSTNLVSSGSMAPNLQRGDHIITLRSWIAYPGGRMPNRGDVVLFQLPAGADKGGGNGNDDVADREGAPAEFKTGDILVKRVVGLPGETVQIKDDVVYINGRALPRDYQIAPSEDQDGLAYPYAVQEPLTVPPGEVFVLGDNYHNSDDGRFWGTLPRENIVGRCVGTLFHEGQAGPNSARLFSASNTPDKSAASDE